MYLVKFAFQGRILGHRKKVKHSDPAAMNEKTWFMTLGNQIVGSIGCHSMATQKTDKQQGSQRKGYSYIIGAADADEGCF